MRVLALDCAGAACAVAVVADGAVLAQRHELMARGQDARLLPLIQEALAEAALNFAALDRVVVLRGPGSFTGLRIALAAARGLGLALDKPVLGIDRLWLHRENFPAAAALLVVLDSRREERFCQHFSHGLAAVPFLAHPAQLATYDRADVCVTGDGAAAYAWQKAQIMPLPSAEVVLAAQCAANLLPEDHLPVPLYLRAPEVSCGPAPAQEEAAW